MSKDLAENKIYAYNKLLEKTIELHDVIRALEENVDNEWVIGKSVFIKVVNFHPGKNNTFTKEAIVEWDGWGAVLGLLNAENINNENRKSRLLSEIKEELNSE